MERIFFRHLLSPNHVFFCAKNIFSSHLATMAIGSANPAYASEMTCSSGFHIFLSV